MRREMIQALPLQELHTRHARFARTLNRSESTIAWHQATINSYCRFVEHTYGVPAPITLHDFTLERARDYILALRGQYAWVDHPVLLPRQERTLSDHSVNGYVRALRAFASWLYEQEYTETNVLGRLKAPQVTKKTVEILTDDEIARVLSTLTAPTATNARNRAIFLTLLDTGIRASELLTLTLPRLHLEEGYLVVRGKGKKERPVKIGQTAAQAIRLYVARYRPTPARPGTEEVFLTETYRVPLSTDGLDGSPEALSDAAPGAPLQQSYQEELLFHQPGLPLTYNTLKSLFHRLRQRANVPRIYFSMG